MRARPKPEHFAQAAPWAEAIRAARERIDISQRELARRVGLAQETIRSAELGRPPRRSTLLACLEALPTLRAGQLLPGRPSAPVATPGAWRALASLFGFTARSVSAERVPGRSEMDLLTVRVMGLRTLSPEAMYQRATCIALVRAACLGCPEFLRSLGASTDGWRGDPDRWRGNLLREERNGARHVFKLRKRPTGLEIDYLYTAPIPRDSPHELPLDIATETLVLSRRWSKKAAMPARLAGLVRPEPIPAEDADPQLSQRMYPNEQRIQRRQGVAVWTLRHPLPGFAHSLAEPPPTLRLAASRPSLPEVLRSARRASGLSTRQVASVADRSHASLLNAESGDDPRATTLAGYLRALPDLAPQDLLPAIARDGDLQLEETWNLVRDIYGYEVDRITKTVTVEPDGTSTNVIDTQGLRPLRASLRDFRVRSGLHRAVAQAGEGRLLSVETDMTESRVRLIRRQEGPVVHEFRFPRRPDGGALAYRRTHVGAEFPLRRLDAGPDLPPDEPVTSGVVLPVYHPARKIVVRVLLPRGFEPEAVHAIAYAACVVADTPMPALSSLLAPPPCRIESRRGQWTLSLSVKQPQVGTRYGITWRVP